MRRWDDTIVPYPRRAESRFTLPFDSRFQLGVDSLADRLHDGGELFGAHDAGPRGRPCPEEAWRVCSSAKVKTEEKKINDQKTFENPKSKSKSKVESNTGSMMIGDVYTHVISKGKKKE